MNIETILIASICQKVFPLDPPGDSEDYLALFAVEIDRIGRILTFLGLAEKATKSHLPWKPNPRLIEIIAERLAVPSKKSESQVTENDRAFICSFILYATGDIRRDPSAEAFEFCCSVLAALGLLDKGRSGGFKPTRRLSELILEACSQQPSKTAHGQ